MGVVDFNFRSQSQEPWCTALLKPLGKAAGSPSLPQRALPPGLADASTGCLGLHQQAPTDACCCRVRVDDSSTGSLGLHQTAPTDICCCRVRVDEHMAPASAPHVLCNAGDLLLDPRDMTPATYPKHRPGYLSSPGKTYHRYLSCVGPCETNESMVAAACCCACDRPNTSLEDPQVVCHDLCWYFDMSCASPLGVL